ncbi:MAG: ankyrin repeat domain-containing protein [Rickettsiaceae bacterium]|nr:ankyrin repeat domain-containing protein [Rickettsiaceae bacterium]
MSRELSEDEKEKAAALESGPNEDIAQENSGEMPNTVGPLLSSILTRDYDQFVSLIDAGFDVNEKNSSGMSALMFASVLEDNDFIDLLIYHGADLEVKDDTGNTALGYACMSGNQNNALKLLSFGADPNVKNNNGLDVMMISSIIGLPEVIKLLVDHGVSVNTVDLYGRTPLMWASCNGHINIIDLLVKNGADINLQDIMYHTALMYAVYNEHPESAVLLLCHGATPHALDADGKIAENYSASDEMQKIFLAWSAIERTEYPAILSKLINSEFSSDSDMATLEGLRDKIGESLFTIIQQQIKEKGVTMETEEDFNTQPTEHTAEEHPHFEENLEHLGDVSSVEDQF